MGRLLTGDEIEALDGRQNMVATYEDKVVAKAQDAKSIKAVGEWLDGLVYDCDTVYWPVELLIAIVEMQGGTWDNGQS